MIWTAHVVSEVFLIPDTRRNHLAAALVVVLSIVFETLVELATLQHGLWKYAPGLRTSLSDLLPPQSPDPSPNYVDTRQPRGRDSLFLPPELNSDVYSNPSTITPESLHRTVGRLRVANRDMFMIHQIRIPPAQGTGEMQDRAVASLKKPNTPPSRRHTLPHRLRRVHFPPLLFTFKLLFFFPVFISPSASVSPLARWLVLHPHALVAVIPFHRLDATPLASRRERTWLCRQSGHRWHALLRKCTQRSTHAVHRPSNKQHRSRQGCFQPIHELRSGRPKGRPRGEREPRESTPVLVVRRRWYQRASFFLLSFF